MTASARLAALLEGLPDTATLPVAWLRAQLAEEPLQMATVEPGVTLTHDLTAKEFGACFGRSASSARLWCERGQVEGAWKLNGREWRIPVASVERFRHSQGAPAVDTPRPSAGSLSDWRRHRKAG